MTNKLEFLSVTLLCGLSLFSSVILFAGALSDSPVFRKIIPASACYSLCSLSSSEALMTQCRVLLEFQKRISLSTMDLKCLLKPLFFENFCTADVMARDIFRLAKNKSVIRIYVLSQVSAENNSSVLKKQIVIGVIDRNFDWKNKCFLSHSGNESRIISLWDQTAEKDLTGDNDIPYGIEYG